MGPANAIPNPENLQGLILRGYTHPYSCHLLFGFSGNSDTQSFFNDIYDKIQSADDWGDQKPNSMLNIGLTYTGIQKLEVVDNLSSFSNTFIQGPASGNSQQSLGDWYDPNSTPSTWWNGNKDAQDNLCCVVHAYGLTEADLNSLVDMVSTSSVNNNLVEYYALKNDARLYQSIIDNNPSKIHFGYTDGISNPSLKNSGFSGLPNQEDINNFVIGYGYGSISAPGPFGADSSAARFAKDGCYNAFRIFHQDVATFNKFLRDQAVQFADTLSYLNLSEEELIEWFAAKLCGRWRNGSPIMLNPDQPSDDNEREITEENFGYNELTNVIPQSTLSNNPAKAAESSGAICPFSAHTRVANPRNQPLDVSMEGTNGPPRILRRGMAYGEVLNNNQDDNKERGLIGLFLCGNLVNQFELLYGWMNNNNFSEEPVFSIQEPPQDAILGNRYYADQNGVVKSFKIPLDGAPGNLKEITIPELPNFLSIKGTAYCLMPSMSSLAKIAGR